MKLFKNALYLTRDQWRKVFLAMSIMTLCLYAVAMVISLCGGKYFILNYNNERLQQIEGFLSKYKLYDLLTWFYSLIEFSIVMWFIIGKRPKWYFLVGFYVFPLMLFYTIPNIPIMVFTIMENILFFLIPLFTQLIDNHRVDKKLFIAQVIRALISIVVTLLLQMIIYMMKSGVFSVENHIMDLPATFAFSLEYDIALSVLLATIALYIDREKGDNVCQVHYGFSQTSTKQLQKSNTKKNLTKTQKIKLKLLYAKFYLGQLGAFALLMVLPFLLGKVVEFLIMYLAFAITRYILGFKYSLHYKKEALCITVGVVVFGVLSLVVPFFYIIAIAAILLGVGLAVFLHFSYKYKGMWLFNSVAKPDKFAEVYVMFDGDLTERHVKMMCHHYGLDDLQTTIVWEVAKGEKMSTIAYRHNYSVKTIERMLNESINTINDKL